ncbi:MAG: ATP-dependent zinc protease [Planctomycetaceae bacterium]|nr:ATP-dependent zinc protease [Planctomycetaceae bacterium]
MTDRKRRRRIIGWREWVALPDLGIRQIKAKVDTGARSSAIHASELERFEVDGKPWIRFQVFPQQTHDDAGTTASAPILDERLVRSSSGRASLRIVIATTVVINRRSHRIEVTLANRRLMGFRMLLGREAIRGRYLVDSSQSFLTHLNLTDSGTESEPGGSAKNLPDQQSH